MYKGKIERDDSRRSFSDEKRYAPKAPKVSRHPVYQEYDHRDRYAPYPHERRGPSKKTFDSDFDQEAKSYGNKVRRDDQRPYGEEAKAYGNKVRRDGPRPYDEDQEAKTYGKLVRRDGPRPYKDDYRRSSFDYNRSP